VHVLDPESSFIVEDNELFRNGSRCIERARGANSRSGRHGAPPRRPVQEIGGNVLEQPAPAAYQARYRAENDRAMRVVVKRGETRLKPPLARQRALGMAPPLDRKPSIAPSDAAASTAVAPQKRPRDDDHGAVEDAAARAAALSEHNQKRAKVLVEQRARAASTSYV
jgi:hypothetical protein